MSARITIWKLEYDEQNYHLLNRGTSSSLDEGSLKLESGIYTTFRTYQHKKALNLTDHFFRLEQSANLQNLVYTVPRDILRRAIRELVGNFPGIDIRIRIHCAFEKDEITTYLMAEPFYPLPESMYVLGAAAEIIDMQRINPESKATNFINKTYDLRKAKPSGINEYLMTGVNGELLEGMSSNVFVVKNKKIWTARKGILKGITREVVIQVIEAEGIELHWGGFPAAEIFNADEVFITSASRGVLPITIINSVPIGDGKPGKVTQKIRSAFERRLQSELRSI